ncbi:Bgt-1133, partial [Blumeria graminis f. sp. tritici]
VENVKVLGGGEVSTVTLHLTAHHLILLQHFTNELPSKEVKTQTRESWFAYPMIANCTFRPTSPGSALESSIRLRGRDFRFFTLNFSDEKLAWDVYESLKGATCRLGSIEKLYAFHYEAPPPERQVNGWSLYNAKEEWRRQGISSKSKDKGWRISRINADYTFAPTYPALLPVPSSISDNTLNYAGRYRSRSRIPVLTYLHPVNNCSIIRSSQPLTGLRGNRSVQDEKLVHACFSAPGTECEGNSTSAYLCSTRNLDRDSSSSNNSSDSSTQRPILDDLNSSSSLEEIATKDQIYGAQRQNLIVDARPTVNALAMQAVGLGSENMDHYKFASKIYLGIDNIHVMRDSLGKVIEAIKDSDISKISPNKEKLAKSGWLKHITGLLEGSALIARQVGIRHSNVLIHCSDGWDRTSQLSALAQLLLDPYYRTIDGFIVLIEKDWLAFGHMFQHRSGFLNSEKWFSVQSDALAGSAIQPGSNNEGRGDAIENAFLSAKRFFNKSNQSQEGINDFEAEILGQEETVSKSSIKDDITTREATKPKETSPVFHQFLDATYQLLHQYPTRFEFNERFLRRLLYHLYSCQYGTFLYNSEKSRREARVQDRTASVWGYFLSRRAEFTNKDYSGGEIDDHVCGKERILLPHPDRIRWWNEIFNRTDKEMNGPGHEDCRDQKASIRTLSYTDDLSHTNPTITVARQHSVSGKMSSLTGLRDGIAGLALGIGKSSLGQKSPSRKQPIELEMQ